MSFKKLLPFIVILAILGGFAVLRKGNDAPPSIIEQAGLEALAPEGLEAGDLVKLELYAAASPDEKVVLEKDGKTWKIASSYGAPVDEETLSDYLDMVAALQGEKREVADSDEKLARYELKDDQAFRLLAYDKVDGEAVVDLFIGKSDGRGGVFLRRAGENQVYTEAANPRQDAGIYGDDMSTAPADDKWLDKDITDFEREDIAKIEMALPDKTLTFEKVEIPVETPEPVEGEEDAAPLTPPTPEFEWKLTSGGLGGEHKQTALDNILLKASSLRARSVADPAKKAEWGLDAPAYRCAVTMADGTELTVEGGRPDPNGNGYVRIADTEADLVYEVSSYDFGQLFPKGKDLFTLPSWDLEEDDITSIVIDQPEARVVLTKIGEDWTVTIPSLSLEVQSTAIGTLVSSLASWSPEDYADAGTDTGSLSRSISISAGGATHSVKIGDGTTGIDGVYAKVEGEDVILAMRRGDVEKMFLKPRDVYKLKLLDLTESQVSEIEVRQGGSVVTLARKDGGWSKAVSGAGPEDPVTLSDADTSAADDVAYAVTELQAKDINPNGGTDVGETFAEISVKSTEGGVYTLRFGPGVDGVHALNLNNQGAILEIEQDDLSGFLEKVTELTAPAVEEAQAEAEATEPEEDATETAEEASETKAETVVTPGQP